jgi:hypothetical protein
MGAPLAGCRKPDSNLFPEGHDFSRAVSDAKSVRLQPLRFTANVVNEFFRKAAGVSFEAKKSVAYGSQQ